MRLEESIRPLLRNVNLLQSKGATVKFGTFLLPLRELSNPAEGGRTLTKTFVEVREYRVELLSGSQLGPHRSERAKKCHAATLESAHLAGKNRKDPVVREKVAPRFQDRSCVSQQ